MEKMEDLNIRELLVQLGRGIFLGAKFIKCLESIFHGTFGDFTQPCLNGLFWF